MSTPQLSRRGILRTAAGSGLLAVSGFPAFGASDFWNKKAASEWSEEEIQQLRTKSPWAKKVHLEAGGGRGGGRGEGGGMGADSGGSGGGGGGGRGGSRGIRPGEPNPGGGGAGVDVFVRWENAAPLMEATKLKLPPALENHYCISVTGLPPRMLMMLVSGGGRGRGQSSAAEAPPEDPAARQKEAVERLLHSATLTVKGGDPQSPDTVMQTGDKQSLIFAFPKQNLPLTATDKEVQFTMNVGMSPIKAKFEPKEMVFKGEFSV